MTLPISIPQRRTTDSSRARRARCSAAKRAQATELHRATDRAQALLADDAAATATARSRELTPAARPASSGRSLRVADAVVAQWLLEQVPRHGARRAHAAA
ncbi:MAG TPA: hypothetical protein VD836_12645 [Solirubrobacteraceae bacterium]|nr:hypothetical protein [Solirubrobacteraceae bacterium]